MTSSSIGDKKRAIHNFVKAHEIIGTHILPLSFDPALDNIRNMATFINIINTVENTTSTVSSLK